MSRKVRKAVEADIIIGANVLLIGDSGSFFPMTIHEVINPSSMWKAFTADDGCRYGLDGLYVEVSA